MYRLPSWNTNRFAVAGDVRLFDELTLSLIKRQSEWDGPWTRFNPDEYRHSTMGAVLSAWCGEIGRFPLSDVEAIANAGGPPNIIDDHFAYLSSIDHLGLLTGENVGTLAEKAWHLFDMGSLMDFALLSAFVSFDRADMKIIEVGGGFGRLAEFLTLVTGARFRYVNIDAAPISLMFSYRYLTERFPDRRTVMFSPDRSTDDWDFLLVPAWLAEELPLSNFDLAINIESFQEMRQELVDYYLQFIDKRLRLGGIAYIANSKEYLFRGEWNYPPTWACQYRHRTARSWTADHPAEVFLKTLDDNKGLNFLRNAAFAHEVAAYRKRMSA